MMSIFDAAHRPYKSRLAPATTSCPLRDLFRPASLKPMKLFCIRQAAIRARKQWPAASGRPRPHTSDAQQCQASPRERAFPNCASASRKRGKSTCPRSQSLSRVHQRTRALFTQICTALSENRYNP